MFFLNNAQMGAVEAEYYKCRLHKLNYDRQREERTDRQTEGWTYREARSNIIVMKSPRSKYKGK